MTAWGTGPWGAGSWGGVAAAADGISIANAYATTTHSVRVTLTAEPRHASGVGEGDALNPTVWEIVREDTNAAFTVLGVQEVSARVYDVLILQPLASWRITHRIATSTLRSLSGMLVTSPESAEFLGCEAPAERTPQASSRRYTSRDLKNLPAPTRLQTLAGTLVISPAGDYAIEEGNSLVRKLIIRRLTTARGAFFHLPDYGLGIAVKEPLPDSSLIRLRAEAERQVKLEPEIADARVSLSRSRDGSILYIGVQAKTRSGDDVQVETTLSQGSEVA